MIRQIPKIIALLPIVMLFLTNPNTAYSQSSHACNQLVNCDCENVGGGLLNRAWKPRCLSCQQIIREACVEVFEFELAYNAAREAGYCSNVCGGIVGPNSKPKPPEELKVPDVLQPAPPFRPANIELRCGSEEELVFEEDGLLQVSGCSKHGKKEGLWIAENVETGEIVEIFYSAGTEIWRRVKKV